MLLCLCPQLKPVYRIAGKFGGDFNLAVWRIVRTSPNLNSRQIKSALIKCVPPTCTYICICARTRVCPGPNFS